MNWGLLGKGIDGGLDTVNKITSPISQIGGLIGNRLDRRQQQEQFNDKMDEEKRQFDLSHLLKKAEMQQTGSQFDRSKNMSAIDMLANQRSGAMQQFGRRALKDSFFKG